MNNNLKTYNDNMAPYNNELFLIVYFDKDNKRRCTTFPDEKTVSAALEYFNKRDNVIELIVQGRVKRITKKTCIGIE